MSELFAIDSEGREVVGSKKSQASRFLDTEPFAPDVSFIAHFFDSEVSQHVSLFLFHLFLSFSSIQTMFGTWDGDGLPRTLFGTGSLSSTTTAIHSDGIPQFWHLLS